MPKITCFSRKARRSSLLFILVLLTFVSGSRLYAQLQADFQADKPGGCSPLTVSFNNTTRGASASATYLWDFGNGNTSTLRNPGAVYKDEISYTVKLTVTDGAITSSRSLGITVYKKPVADFSAAASKVCLPAPATFIDASSAGDGYIASYLWDFGDGITQQGSSGQMNYYYKEVQKATVNMTVTTSHGCVATVTKNNIVEILPEMKPAFTYSKSLLCKTDESVTFTNTSTGPGTLTWDWQFGDGTSDNTKSPSHTYNRKGLFSTSLKISNEYGCQASVSNGPINVATFNTDFSNSMLCREVSFSATNYYTLTVTAAQWQFGDNTSSNDSYSVKKTYATEGPYTVQLINTYNNLCNDTVVKTIEVKDNVNYNTVINVPANGCINGQVNFSTSSSVAPSARYWTFGNGNTDSYSAFPTSYYSVPGTYTVKLTNTFGTCKEEVTKQIVINGLPDIKPFDITFGSQCGAPVTITYKDKTPDAVSWEWSHDFNYNLPVSTSRLQSPSFNYSDNGYYYVYLTVKNAAGCQATTSNRVDITVPSVTIRSISDEYPGGTFNCGDVKAKFAFTASDPLIDFQWDFGDGNKSTDMEPEFLFTKEGSTRVTLTYTTAKGCKGIASTNSSIVYRKPKANFDYTVPPCEGNLVVNLMSSSNPFTHGSWYFSDGGFSGGRSTPHVFADTGRYIVKHIGFNGGCSDTISKEIYANVLPKYIRITSVSPQLCTGTRGEVTFDQTSYRATGSSWNFGDGTVIPYDTAAHNIKHTYTKSGRYQITLTAKSDGCSLQQTANTVILLKQNPVLTGSPASICSNQAINVSISGLETNPYVGNYSYDQQYYQYTILRFEYEDGSPFTGSAGSNFNYNNYGSSMTGLKVGDVRIRAIITNMYTRCQDTTNYIAVKVNGPQAGLKITTNNVCWKTPLVFESTSTTPTNTRIVSWEWSFGDGKSETKSDATPVAHNYADPGTYPVSLTVTDAAGCRSTASSSAESAMVKGPKVAFTASGLYVPDVPLNTTVTFNNNTNAANNTGNTYVWDYGNGIKDNVYNGSQTYTTAGSYTVKLTATDPVSGCTDAATRLISVKDFNTAFKFNARYIGAGSCLPVQLSITNLSVNATSYSWDFGDGFRIEGPYAPSHTYTTPGKKVITLYSEGYNNLKGIYKDSIFIEESSATMKVDVLKGCTGQEVLLSATALNTTSYVWDMGDGTIQQTTSDAFYKHTYLSPGIFTPKVLVKDAKGCANAAGIADKIIIDSLNVSISAIPQNLCQYSDNIFTPAIYSIAESYAGEKLDYKWDYGTGNSAGTSSEKQGVFTYDNHGVYTIKLKVTSPYGCVKEDSKRVDVHEKLGLHINAPSSLDVCKNSSIVIPVTGAVSYEWIGNTEGLSNTQTGSPSATPSADALYTVVGYDTWKCSSDTAEISVIVRPLPTVDAGADVQVVANTDQPLLASGSSTVVQYTWTPSVYLSCSSCAAPVVRPKKSTRYVVRVKTEYNCVSSDTILVKLQCLNGYIYIPNSFTPNRDGKNEVFYIKGKGIGIIRSLRIFSRWGDMVFERTNFEIDDRSAGWNGYKNGQPAAPGTYVYIAEMQCEDGGEVVVKKGTVTVLY